MRIAIGAFFLAFGVLFLMVELDLITSEVSSFIWPLLFIALGIVVLAKKDRKSTEATSKEREDI